MCTKEQQDEWARQRHARGTRLIQLSIHADQVAKLDRIAQALGFTNRSSRQNALRFLIDAAAKHMESDNA